MGHEDGAITQYNKDVASMDGYIYTGNKATTSMRLFNKRATLAIQNLVDVEGKSIIDIGCGDGTYTVELVKTLKASSAVGVEPSDAWKLAGKKFGDLAPKVTFAHGSAYSLEFEDGSFDVAFMRGVLHHLDDPMAGLREMFRVAGRVFLLEPNGYNPIIKMLEKFSPYHRAHNERSFAPARLRRWMRDMGGEIEGDSFSSLVPLLCPDRMAVFLDWLSPVWERIPLIPKISCGLYCVVARGGARESAEKR